MNDDMSMNEKREIVDVGGTSHKLGCLSCAIAENEVQIRGGSVIRTEYFDVHQDFEIPIPGFMILTSLRHLMSVDEFTDDEQRDFMSVLCDIRKLQRSVLGIDVVYLHQEEDTSHHFHLWMFPRHPWMSEHGRKVESMRPIMEYARQHLKTDKDLAELDKNVRQLRDAARELGY